MSRNRLVLYIIFVLLGRKISDKSAFITDTIFCRGASTPFYLVSFGFVLTRRFYRTHRRDFFFPLLLLTHPVRICYRVAGFGNLSCCISFLLVSQVRRSRLFWNRAVQFGDMPIRWNVSGYKSTILYLHVNLSIYIIWN